MFSSKTPRDLNRDPEPWKVWLETPYAMHGHREWRGAADDWDDALVRAEDAYPRFQAYSAICMPRPEYDHPQHNEPNGILVEFRSNDDTRDPIDWLRYSEAAYFGPTAHIDHARRVLTRLARVGVS
ncbi:hypothetical protein ACSBPH_01775 [Microbacterium sp. F51-2R]|uniref:hypothetical protein n=1 Tax=Microbacterium sp. F51-2R TaxID=3445777 RepID=UPI003FA16EA4